MTSKHIPSEVLDRVPPQNLEAERGALGSLLLDPDRCDEISPLLKPADFYLPQHQALYGHLLAMHNESLRIDATLLHDRLKKSGDLDTIGGLAYLAEVADSVPTAANAVYYAQIVKTAAIKRAVIYLGGELVRSAFDDSVDAHDLMSRAEQLVFRAVEQRVETKLHDVSESLLELIAELQRRFDGEVVEGEALPTGLVDLDEVTDGMHAGELVICAGRPGDGKSTFAHCVASAVAVDRGLPVLFFSLEMRKKEILQRFLAARANVPFEGIRKCRLSADDVSQITKASHSIASAPIILVDQPESTVTDIAAAARRLKRQKKLALVVIDYLQLIEPDNPRDPRQEQVAKISRRLKALALDLDVPVLCLAQLNRQAEAAKDSRPRLSHLRESGAIEQDADTVLLLYHDENAKKGEPTSYVLVGKQRNGPKADVPVCWRPEFTAFENYSPESNDGVPEF